MGMYTGLRCHIEVKPEFWPVIEEVMKGFLDDDLNDSDPWDRAATKFPEYRWLRSWSNVDRANFIPFGALAYMPWDDKDPEWEPEKFENGFWKFQCSLKNYQGEIEYFVETILKRITLRVCELYSLYEENEAPEHIDL